MKHVKSETTPTLESVAWLQSRLRRAGAKHFTIEATAFAFTALAAAVLGLAVYALSDYFVDFPVAVRRVLSLALAAGSLALLVRFALRRIRPLKTPDAVARTVERLQDGAGRSQHSMIVSALEFGERPAIPGSVALKNAVIRQARDACVNPLQVRLHDPRHVRLALRLAASAAVILILWIAFAMPYLKVFLKRAAGMKARYPTTTLIQDVAWSPRAPSRQDYPIRITAAGRLPTAGYVSVKYPGRRAFRLPVLPVTNGVYTVTVPGPEKPFAFEFALGDYRSDRYAVDIREPAAIRDGILEIQPPAYTALPVKNVAIGSVTVPEGSTIVFHLTPTKPVKSCGLVLGDRRVPFERQGTGAYTARARFDESSRYEIQMVGEDDLANNDRSPYAVSVVKDGPPKIEVQHPKPNSFLCNLSILQFDFDIKDDYGVASASVEYEVFRKRGPKDENEIQVRKGSIPVTLAGRGKTEHGHVVQQAKELAATTGERIVFKAVAMDNREGKASRGEADQVAVFVVSPEELRGILESEQSRVSALMRKLRDDEQKQAEAIQRRLKEGVSS